MQNRMTYCKCSINKIFAAIMQMYVEISVCLLLFAGIVVIYSIISIIMILIRGFKRQTFSTTTDSQMWRRRLSSYLHRHIQLDGKVVTIGEGLACQNRERIEDSPSHL